MKQEQGHCSCAAGMMVSSNDRKTRRAGARPKTGVGPRRSGTAAVLLGSLLCLSTVAPLQASDLVRLSGSAANEGAGGLIALDPNPQTALLSNPALLTGMADGQNFTVSTLGVNSDFTSKLGEVAAADPGPGVLPELGIKGTLGQGDWSWGAGFVVQSALRADFNFQDPPGTGGVSYGVQQHLSEWVVAQLGGALSYRVSDRLSAGLSLGLAYNRNRLDAPYIFQSHPLLTGSKVLVDLEVDDVALTSALGLTYQGNDSLELQLAYSRRTDFSADGDLSGNLGQLGLGIEETFRYRANVETALPAVLVAGATWQVSDRLTLGAQWDRIFWKDSFDTLPIRLTAGSNAELNAFLGADSIVDVAPLDWRDQDNFHLGGEYLLVGGGKFRLGYESSEAPVPGRTFTPMTGAILDRAFTAGLQFRLGRRDIDVAYRFADGDDLLVVDSALAGGEYDNTRQSLALHTLVISVPF